MVSLYMDEQIPAAVSRGLRLRGIDVLTDQEDGTDGWPDPRLLDRALGVGRVVFTEDRDFLIEATRRQRHGEQVAGVLYIHQWDLIVGRCIEDLELVCHAGRTEDFTNLVWYL